MILRRLGSLPLALPLVGLALFFGGLELAARADWVSPMVMPPPSSLPAAWWGEVSRGWWWRSVEGSLSHYWLGLAVGSAVGVLAGLLTGLIPAIERLTAGIVRVIRPIPGLAWVPFAIVWFGITPTAAVFVIAISVVWINFYAAQAAVQAVDPDLLELAAAFGQNGFVARLTRIVLPAAAPAILGGVRAGLGQGWMAVVAAELFGVPGLGARMMQAASLLATDIVIIYMLTMALLYAATDMVFVLIRDRILIWQR